MEKPKLYVSDGCGVCTRIKEYISENNINVDIVNIKDAPDGIIDYFIKKGVVSVPILEKEGKLCDGSDEIKKCLM